MKLCVDCKHHDGDHFCARTGEHSPVDGSFHSSTCATERGQNGSCGPEGRFFEESVLTWKNVPLHEITDRVVLGEVLEHVKQAPNIDQRTYERAMEILKGKLA